MVCRGLHTFQDLCRTLPFLEPNRGHRSWNRHLLVKRILDGERPRSKWNSAFGERLRPAPSVICNVLGNDLFKKYEFSAFSLTGSRISDKSTNQPVGWLICKRFFEVEPSEPPFGPEVGPSPFKPGVAYMIGATRPEEEQEGFAAMKSSQSTTDRSPGKTTPLTQHGLRSIGETSSSLFAATG